MSSNNTIETPQSLKPFWLNNYIPYLSPLAVVFLSILVYSNALWNGFVFDDIRHITKNEFIREVQYIPGYFTLDFWKMGNFLEKPPYYRPFFLLSLFMDYKLWGLNPFGFHLTNILIHALITMLLYFIALNFFQDRFVAFSSSLIFALHPIHTEAVTFISARTHLLAALFFFLSVWSFLKCRNHRNLYYYISIISFAFALLSNEIAIVLPIILILIGYEEANREVASFQQRIFKTVRPFIPYLALIIGYLFLRGYIIGMIMRPVMTAADLYHRILTAIWIVAKYIRLLVFPVDLNPYYPAILFDSVFAPSVLFSLFLLGFMIIVLLTMRKRDSRIFFSMLWIFIPIIPTLAVLFYQVFHRVGYVMMAERYLYIPSAGFAFLTGLLIKKVIYSKPVESNLYYRGLIYAITSGLVLLYATGTIYQNTFWKDDYTLYARVIQKITILGDEYLRNNLPDKAITAYKEALGFNRYNPEVHDKLGIVYSKMALFDKAVIEHKKAQKLRNNMAKTSYVHGIKENPDDSLLNAALSEYLKSFTAGREDISSAIAYNMLGGLYYKEGMFEDAIQEYKRAIEVDPNYARAHNDLAIAYIKVGMPDQAISEFKEAAHIEPDAVEPHYNMGLLYQEKGMLSLAIEEYKKVLQMRPNFDLAKERFKELQDK